MLAQRRKRRWRQLVWDAAVKGGGDMIFTCYDVANRYRRWSYVPSLVDVLSPVLAIQLNICRAIDSLPVGSATSHNRHRSSAAYRMGSPVISLPAPGAPSADSESGNVEMFMAWSKDRCCHLRPQSSDNSLRSACSPSLTLPLRAQIVYLSAQLRRLLA